MAKDSKPTQDRPPTGTSIGGSDAPSAAPDQDEKLTVHYIKSPSCLDLPVHGAFGGINPVTGLCHMAVFAERPPIPKEIDLIIQEGKAVGEERRGRTGMVRMVGAVLYFDINAAIAIHQWLGDKIKLFRKEHPELSELFSDFEETK